MLASIASSRLGKPRAKLVERSSEAGVDPASPETADRTCRRVRPWRLSAAGSYRAAPRPCHRLRPAPWPRCRDNSRCEIIRADVRKAAGSGPRADAFDGALNLNGYSVEGIVSEAGATEVRLSALFRHLPVAVLKARSEGALKPARKRVSLLERKAAGIDSRTAWRMSCRLTRGRFPSPRRIGYSSEIRLPASLSCEKIYNCCGAT